jgi:hypothetical protein
MAVSILPLYLNLRMLTVDYSWGKELGHSWRVIGLPYR